jgi:hypothetical protein
MRYIVRYTQTGDRWLAMVQRRGDAEPTCTMSAPSLQDARAVARQAVAMIERGKKGWVMFERLPAMA